MTEVPYPETPAQTSTLAIISLISGIVSWFMFPVVGGIVAVITGHMALRELRESQGGLTGEGMAKVGLVLGYLHLALVVLGFCVVAVFLALGVTPFLCIPFVNEISMPLGSYPGF